MKILWKCLAVLVIGAVLGVGSALGMFYLPIRSMGVGNGPWLTNLEIGSADANMYVRAFVARVGLFALNKTETVYYTATTDDDGEPLRSGCDYRIEGVDPPTRWWSITLYGEDHFLIPNDRDRWSFGKNTVARAEDRSYVIHLSPDNKPGNWLPSGKGGQLVSLSMRLYNPEPVVYEKPESVKMPRIVKEGCK